MTVVVGVDGSAGSQAAIRLAATEARYRSAPLLAVMAYSGERPLGAPASRPVSTLRTAADERATTEVMLQDIVRDALGGQADGVTCRTVAGLPGRVLVTVAREIDAQLIVLAARSDTPVARVLGAVSQQVLRNAPCPVLVVPGPGTARQMPTSAP
jgi:nucleotide-binding universal stress UspA family protein